MAFYINKETAENYAWFDLVASKLEKNLKRETVVALLGTHTTKQYVTLLNALVPANIRHGVAKMPKSAIKNDRIFTLFMGAKDTVQVPKDMLSSPTAAQQEVIMRALGSKALPPDIYDAEYEVGREVKLETASGLTIWLAGNHKSLVVNSRPGIIASNDVPSDEATVILLHELTHVRQCIERPIYEVASDAVSLGAERELEAYDFHDRYETALLHEGALDPLPHGYSSTARKINYYRKRLKPSAANPYQPTPQLRTVLKQKGLEPHVFSDSAALSRSVQANE